MNSAPKSPDVQTDAGGATTRATRCATWWIALPALGYLALQAEVTVDLPYLDDYDAALGFALRAFDAEPSERMRLLLLRHNEHPMLTLRASLLALHATLGRIDFRVLGALGAGIVLGLLAALYSGFGRGLPRSLRRLAFAPAAWLLLQPQHWEILLSSTTALSSFAVCLWAALCFRSLERDRLLDRGLAPVYALLGALSLGSGVLIAPLGALLLGARRRPRAAALWGLFALLLTVVLWSSAPAADPGALAHNVAHPLRLLRYFLNFIGCAAGFGARPLSEFAGALLLGASLWLLARGALAAQPVAGALLLFVLGSAATNAALRAQLGVGLPLTQPRYRFFAALLLACLWLLAIGTGPATRPSRRIARLGCVFAALFGAASFAQAWRPLHTVERNLREGAERWLLHGDRGLVHPDFRRADHHLLAVLDREWWRPPSEWAGRHAARLRVVDPPEENPAGTARWFAVYEDGRIALLSGALRLDAAPSDARVSLLLRGAGHTLQAPAQGVPLARFAERGRRDKPPLGFRVLIDGGELPAGAYRVELLVEHGERVWRVPTNRRLHFDP